MAIPSSRSEMEFDILATDNQGQALFGECKWRNQKLGLTVVTNLVEKSKVRNFKKRLYAFFSLSGFADDIENYAKMNPEIYLFDLDKIVSAD